MLVPSLVGCVAAISQLQSIPSQKKQTCPQGLEATFSSAQAVAKLDREIQQELFSRKENPFTEVLPTKKNTVFKGSKFIKVLFLTPKQQKVFDLSSTGLKIIQGPAGSGKTILTVFKALDVASKCDGKFLLLCRGSFAWSYYELFTGNGHKTKMATREGISKKGAQKFFLEALETSYNIKEDCPDTVVVDIKLNPDKLGSNDDKIIIGQSTDFADDFYHKANLLMKLFLIKNLKMKVKDLKKMKTEIRWQQNLHIFMDDGDLAEILLRCKEIFFQADEEEYLTWTVLDHKQSSGFSAYIDQQSYEQVRAHFESSRTELLVLQEVLRNSVEIHNFNMALIQQISSLNHVIHTEKPGNALAIAAPKQGSNFHGPPITIFELYDHCMLEDSMSLGNNFQFRAKRASDFTAFVLTKILNDGAKTEDLPILSADCGEWKIFVGDTLEKLGFRAADLEHRLVQPEEFGGASVVTIENCVLTR